MNQSVIICVDDEHFILSSLGEQLNRHLGHQYTIELVDAAQEVMPLLASLEEEAIDIPLIIADEMMPKLQGHELLIQVHQHYPQTLKMLMTGHSDIEAIRKSVNGANLYRYLAKPWEETDLILTVTEALRRYEQEQQLRQQHAMIQLTNIELEQSISLLQATLESTADGILVTDQAGKITNFNHKFTELWSIPADVLTSRTRFLQELIRPLLNADDFRTHIQRLHQRADQEHHGILHLNDGRIFEAFTKPQFQGKSVLGRVWSFRDVTEQQRAQAIIHYQARHDTLTKLPNRASFHERLSGALADAAVQETKLAVMFVDLDRFKTVNDTLGHAVGDLLLQQVVERMQSGVRASDYIARWGGDEFTLLLTHIADRADVDAIAHRILEAMTELFELDGHHVRVTTSIGIAVFPDDGEDADTLLKNADAALYCVKEKGRNGFQHFALDLHTPSRQTLALETSLHTALQGNEFMVYYQPQVNVLTGQVTQMEALLRWQHPTLGMISPQIFISLAEQTGLIVPLGEWVLRTACQQAREWQAQGCDDLMVGVNLSAKQLRDPNLSQKVASILNETGLAPHCLELEITETAAMEDMDLTYTILTELQQLGVNLALDDFGTGYSSLGYLKRLPFDTLKIDQCFVRDLHTDIRDVAIVNAIINLAQGLDLRIVAEGVETEDLKTLLWGLHCHEMQGYYFSRPVAPQDATGLLQRSVPFHPANVCESP